MKSSKEFLEAETIIHAALSASATKLAQGGVLDKGADC